MSSGNFTAGLAGSVQVLPRSSEWKTEGPQWALSPPASSRGVGRRVSMATE